MKTYCYMCQSVEKLHPWKHPVTDKEYRICNFCLRTIIGVCVNCNEIVQSTEQYSLFDEEGKLCSECTFHSEMSD